MRSPWHHHPGVKTGEQLTLGQRAADAMRNGMGSWPFVFAFLLAMVGWAVLNTILLAKVLHGKPFDPYPYILLNLLLSTLAGLQGAILLIAAKRADQVAAQQALHHLEVSEETKQLVEADKGLTEAVKELTQAIHDHVLGVAAPTPTRAAPPAVPSEPITPRPPRRPRPPADA